MYLGTWVLSEVFVHFESDVSEVPVPENIIITNCKEMFQSLWCNRFLIVIGQCPLLFPCIN